MTVITETNRAFYSYASNVLFTILNNFSFAEAKSSNFI